MTSLIQIRPPERQGLTFIIYINNIMTVYDLAMQGNNHDIDLDYVKKISRASSKCWQDLNKHFSCPQWVNSSLPTQPLNKMAAILQTILSDAFSSMKIF